ncbi:MAG: hypothetical protein R6V26_00845 [Roseovarius sp.]
MYKTPIPFMIVTSLERVGEMPDFSRLAEWDRRLAAPLPERAVAQLAATVGIA